MKITRRGLFATLAAAVIGKPAIKAVPLALMRTWDSALLRRQYRTGKFNFHRDCFAFEWYPVPNSVLPKDEITHRSLMILEQKALINPES